MVTVLVVKLFKPAFAHGCRDRVLYINDTCFFESLKQDKQAFGLAFLLFHRHIRQTGPLVDLVGPVLSRDGVHVLGRRLALAIGWLNTDTAVDQEANGITVSDLLRELGG